MKISFNNLNTWIKVFALLLFVAVVFSLLYYAMRLKPQMEAIRAAKSYKGPSGQVCTMMMTPAVHKASGAKYTFSSGCLPPGWE